MDTLEPLKPMDLGLLPLPELSSAFRITKLAEKPQNPIMDSLQFIHLRSALARALPVVSVQALGSLESDQNNHYDSVRDLSKKSLWHAALEHRHSAAVRLSKLQYRFEY